MLLDKLLYINIKGSLNHIRKDITNEKVPYPTYKELFDFLTQLLNTELQPTQIRIGFRCSKEFKNNEGAGIINLFIAGQKIEQLFSIETMKKKFNHIKDVKLFKVELVKEGLVRSTLLPFDPQKSEIFKGTIYTVSDYVEINRSNKNILKEKLGSFIEISNILTLVRNNYLYKPKDYDNLRENNIFFDDYEVLYLHKWSEK